MKKNLLLIFVVTISFLSANAQWNADPTVNNVVTGASPTTTKLSNVAVSDGAGGMLLAWIDSRTSSSQSIYIQRILADGSLKFLNEVVVTAATGTTASTKSNLNIEEDGAGGAILIWHDARNTTGANSNTDIYGQRVNSEGVALWSAGGIRLTVSDNTVSNKFAQAVLKTSATSSTIIFTDNRAGTLDVFAQKISLATGATLWAADVSVHGAQTGTQTGIAALADGNNGSFIIWQDPRIATTNSDIYAQRLDSTGVALWGASGTVVCDAVFNQIGPKIISDDAGGIVATWQDNRAASADGDIWAQRLNGNGVAQWTANGIAVCIQVGTNQSAATIIKGGGGYIISWLDPRAAISNRNLYANSIDANGATTWTTAAAGGKVICTATGHQPSTSTASGLNLISDGINGAIFIWDDAREGSNNVNIYAQRLNSTGDAQWTADGVLVSTAASNQLAPVSVNSIANTVIIAWRDSRNGTANTELYASQLLLSGVLPVTFIDVTASLLNETATINWQTAAELNSNTFTVERSENGIQFYPIGSLNAIGNFNGKYDLKDTKPVKGTVYYRIKSVDKNGLTQYSAIARVTKSGKEIFVNVFPVPAINTIYIQLGNMTAGNYQLQLVDSKGAVVKRQFVNITGASVQTNINVNNLQTGNYFVQVLTADAKLVKTLMIQKL